MGGGRGRVSRGRDWGVGGGGEVCKNSGTRDHEYIKYSKQQAAAAAAAAAQAAAAVKVAESPSMHQQMSNCRRRQQRCVCDLFDLNTCDDAAACAWAARAHVNNNSSKLQRTPAACTAACASHVTSDM